MGANTLKLFFVSFLLIAGIDLYSQQNSVFILAESGNTGIDFSNNVTETEERNILVKGMPYFYSGGGVGIIDFNNDGLPDIFLVGNQQKSRLYQNNGNLNFTDVTDQMGINTTAWCTGVLIADINDDGWNDIYVLKAQNNDNSSGGNLLYLNEKGKMFSEQSKKYRLDLNDRFLAGSFFDMDNDGDQDLYLARYPDNSAQGNDISFDFYKRYAPGYGTDYLLENVNNKSFKDISVDAGIIPENGFGISVLTADFNNDGWKDIYIGNDFAERDFLYLNQKGKKFKECLTDHFQHTSFFTMGLDYQDLNNDLLPDLISLDMNPADLVKYKQDFSSFDFEIYKAAQSNYYFQEIRNCLQFQNTDGSYSETGQVDKVAFTDWSWSPLAEDFDMDGYKDLFISNGLKRDILNQNIYMYELDSILKAKGLGYDKVSKMEMLGYIKPLSLNNYFFKNEGKNSFTDVSKEWVNEVPGISTGAAVSDLDRDGDLDIVTNNIDAPASIYINQTMNAGTRTFVGFKCKSNSIYGAVVYLYTRRSNQYHEIYPARGFQSCSEPVAVFGLDKGEHIDSLVISLRGNTYRIFNVEPGKYHYVEDLLLNKGIINPQMAEGITITDTICLTTKALVNDFKFQPLLMKKIFPMHPFIKQLDLNSDGVNDFYIGKFYTDPARIYFGTKSGGYTSMIMDDFTGDSLIIDTDIMPIELNGNFACIISSMHVLDSAHQGIRIQHFPGRTKPIIPAFTSGPIIAMAKIQEKASTYIICFGSSGFYNYPSSYDSYVLKWDNKNGLQKDSFMTTRLNQLVQNNHITDAISTAGGIMYTGNFNTINLLGINQNEQMINNILINKKGFWDKITASSDQSFISVSNIGNNHRFNLVFEDSIGVLSMDIDKNQNHDIFFIVNMNGKDYPIYGYKDLLSQFPRCRRNINDIQGYKTADIEKVFDRRFSMSDIKYVNDLRNLFMQNGSVADVPIQFTSLNCFAETDKYFVFGGNDLSFRPDLGNIEAGSMIVVSKTDQTKYTVFNKPFRAVHSIFNTSNPNEFIVQDQNGIYRIKMNFN